MWIWTVCVTVWKSKLRELYEAATIALAVFKKHDFQPGAMTELEVEVRSSITHTVTVTKVHAWLNRGVRSPKEAVLKERLRAML